MRITQTATDTRVRLEIEGDLAIDAAAQLKDELCRALALGRDLEISLEGVSALDITAMQLLWAAARGTGATGHSVTFAHPVPASLAGAVREAGIAFPALLEGEA